MKRLELTIAVTIIVTFILCLGASVSYLGIYQGLLQSDLNGGGYSMTNALNLNATNHTSVSNDTAQTFIVTGTTNQIVFGATNTAPVNATNPVTWISVQVAGSNNVYRVPVYQ